MMLPRSPLRHSVRTFSHLAAAGALLAGPLYSGAQPAPASNLPGPAQLAALVFPGWSDTRAGRLQSVTPPPSPGTPFSGWSLGPTRVIVEPKLVLRTDADHLTLIASMLPAGEDGKPAVAHMTPVGLAAYQFARAGSAWKVVTRQGIFAWRGFFGEARLQQVALTSAPKQPRQAVGVEYGSCWDGYCGTWLALYEVDNKGVRREPVVETALSGNNVDGAPDCLRRLQPLIKTHQQDANVHDDGSPPAGHDCYMVEGNWSIEAGREQPGDLSVHYQGAISRADVHGLPAATIDQRHVLRYSDGKYRAVSGFNPVPPI